jgi:hypothetical protein
MLDKRNECGCHRDCMQLPHECPVPCRWPDCLTSDETAQLVREIRAGNVADMTVQERVEAVLRDFSWDDYGMDDTAIGLSEDPDAQEWLPDLAAQIAGALELEGIVTRHSDDSARRDAQRQDGAATS